MSTAPSTCPMHCDFNGCCNYFLFISFHFIYSGMRVSNDDCSDDEVDVVNRDYGYVSDLKCKDGSDESDESDGRDEKG